MLFCRLFLCTKILKMEILEAYVVVVVFVTMISIVYRYRSILAFPLEFIGHILKHLVITNHYT